MTEEDAMADDAREVAPGTRLVIVRHGEAVSNVEDLIGGHKGCRGLTMRGVAQCEALAERLGTTGELDGAAAVWTSVLPRAIESAAIIAKAIGFDVVEQSCSLCEQHPGEADGISWAEFERRYARVSLPGSDPEIPLSPGGESWVAFLDRAATGLLDVASRAPGQLVVVISHGGVVAASMIRFLGLPDNGAGAQLHAENTSITEWVRTGYRWRLVRFNDVAHLGGSGREAVRSVVPAWVDEEIDRSAVDQQV
ncbi:MAG: histidine phosphatase family protein [Acidimicrobiales bacterium]